MFFVCGSVHFKTFSRSSPWFDLVGARPKWSTSRRENASRWPRHNLGHSPPFKELMRHPCFPHPSPGVPKKWIVEDNLHLQFGNLSSSWNPFQWYPVYAVFSCSKPHVASKSPPGSCEANHSKPQPPKDATPLGIEQHYPPVIKHGVPENPPFIYIYIFFVVGGFNPSEKY